MHLVSGTVDPPITVSLFQRFVYGNKVWYPASSIRLFGCLIEVSKNFDSQESMLEAAKKKTAPPPPTEAPAAKEEACEADDAQECGEEEAAEEDAVEAWAGLGVREHATTATPLGASLVLIFDSCELQDID